MRLEERMEERKDLYRGKILQMHVDTVRLENGKTALRECVDHPGGVAVAALTEQDEILLVRQFRYPYREVVTEVPAGKLDPGEEPLAACKRELLEETGAEGSGYVSLGKLYPSPGYTDERLWLYACRIGKAGEQKLDEDEFLEVLRVPLAKAAAMAGRGELPDAKTQVLILRAQALVREGRL